MDTEKAKEARSLLDDLDVLQDFADAVEAEYNHWWSLVTPDIKRFKTDGIHMPEILRYEFADAVNRAIEKTKKKLEEL